MNPLDGYTAILDITPPEAAYDEQGHLNNVEVLRLFETLRRHYMFQAGGLRRQHLGEGLVVGVREMVCSYVTEAMPGEALVGGCRVLGRSERSYLFDEVIVATSTVGSSGRPDADRVVARARVLECVIDRALGTAISIPPAFWAVIEGVEGRAMPPGPLPFPRTDWS
jgi:acyl-CoA thioesterase FadM